MINPFVLLPLYSYPMGTNWDSVYASIESFPSVPFQIIINPSNGPASSSPDAAFASAVSKLNAYSNTQILGYIHVLDATRSKSEVIADIDLYAAWASYGSADVHLDGIFFDEAPNDATTDTLSYMTDVTSHARSALAVNGATPQIVLNPGTPVDDGFYATADCIVAMEEAYSAFSESSIAKVQSAQRTKSAFILHDFTAGLAEQNSLISSITSGEIPGIYITDSPSYNELSTLFKDMVSSLGGVSPIAGGNSSSVSASTPSYPSTTSASTPSESDSADSSPDADSDATGATDAADAADPTTFVTSIQTAATETADNSGASVTAIAVPTETGESNAAPTKPSRKTRGRKHRRPTRTSTVAAQPTGNAEEDEEDCDSE